MTSHIVPTVDRDPSVEKDRWTDKGVRMRPHRRESQGWRELEIPRTGLEGRLLTEERWEVGQKKASTPSLRVS